MVPLFGQAPLAYFAALYGKYVQTKGERRKIKQAFAFYVPDDVVEQVSRNMANMKLGNKVVHGTCLASDGESFTSLSEAMAPEALSSYLNRYYEVLFEPVKRLGGFVVNVVGDAMLAVWVHVEADDPSNRSACLAALDMDEAVRRFNRAASGQPLPTRIGLHAGPILLGNVGALDHYEYRPVGDIVNTATRIEGLNKYLGTDVLISDAALQGIDGFLTRKVGSFLFLGKSAPLVMHELLGTRDGATPEQERLCRDFAEALEAFNQGAWGDAMAGFSAIDRTYDGDGPSRFFGPLCEQYRQQPPEEPWSGVVTLDRK
jgi:adenylate cyclase